MKFRRKAKQYQGISRRKNNIKPLLVLIGIVLLIALLFFLFEKYKSSSINIPSLRSVYKDWNNKDYAKVYDKTTLILKMRPFDREALALHGFSAYYIFAEQNDFSISFQYLNDAILYLRQAMYQVRSFEKPKVAYMLGKSYYQKGYYYSDLAVKYLKIARDSGLKFKDLPEFLGMSASMLGDTELAIRAFTDALAETPSDLLLFALAENYMKIDDVQNAKLYLFETIEKTKDTLLELKCRYLLGRLFLEQNDINLAEKEFNTILSKDGTSADAHYGLGVVAEIRGEIIKARAEWRKALKLNPLHQDTRAKLNLR